MASPSAERLVETWMASARDEEIEETVSEISNDRITLLNVVKALGEYLTSEEDQLRTKGVEFLSLVLGRCPPEKLSRQSALKAMGKAFVGGYIFLAEGEKDPRNLLIALAIARVILIEFDISDHVESLFNITYCYFPITFRPPPNDPYGITTEDLQEALRGCLSASPLFGPLAVPIWSEKLTAGSPATKQDTLETMSLCLPVYGAGLARVSARKLWNLLKLEIFQPTDPLTEEEALKTTRVLVETIYAHEEAAIESEDDIQGLARDVCEECINILREPEKNQARSAIKVLCTFVTTTPSVSRFTLSHAVPHLVKLFLDPGEVSNRAPILLLLADLANSARDSMTKEVNKTKHTVAPMMPYKDEVLGVVSAGLKSPASRIPALSLLRGIVWTKRLLTDQELGYIVHSVNEVFQSEEVENDDFSDSAVLEVLTAVSKTAPRHVQEQTLPMLFNSLPDRAPPRNASSERMKFWRILLALKALCVHPELFETLVIRLTTKIDLICLPTSPPAIDDLEPDAAYAHSLLKTIADALTAKVDAGHHDVAKYIERLVPSLYNLFIFAALQDLPGIATGHRLVREAADIITSVTQCVPARRQRDFVAGTFKILSTGEVGGIFEGFQKLPPGTSLSLFNESASSFQKNLLALFSAGVVTAHKEVLPSPPAINDFLDQLLVWSITRTDHYLQRESAWHLISSLVNKHAETANQFLDDKLNNFWQQFIANPAISSEQRRLAIEAWVWISKALVVRKDPFVARFTDKLFEVFGDDAISWDAAKALGNVASADQILTKRNRAVVKILHTQKFVNSILPRLILGAQDSTKSPHEQTAYLVALTSMIKATPRAAYAHEMPALMPLLLRGLDLPDFDIRADVIDTLLTAAGDDISEKSLVSEHASTLVTNMLKNSMWDEMPSVRVRTAALEYLSVLPSVVRYDVLHPMKATVLRELAKVLDDPKRSVRKEAVDTRLVSSQVKRFRRLTVHSFFSTIW
ncbi:hypothetical protein H0H81_006471 [Sphagnurus paluster]|uniref:MMS19 nucleotide excision repair protein n=1 Tax=Sphagnurus paluster TaxID=117069 RepID=A0A9P7KLY7_9AGAR|nr:hypothetical protein H0H81_006471 [Sphagnurus paluster]